MSQQKIDYKVGQKSEFPFFGGDQILIVIAPDHPEARQNRRVDERLWTVSTERRGRQEGVRYGREGAGQSDLRYMMSDVLYQTVSSTEVDNRHKEVDAFAKEVHEAYLLRIVSAATT